MIEVKGSVGVPVIRPEDGRISRKLIDCEMIVDKEFMDLPDDQKEREIGAAIRRLWKKQASSAPSG